METSDLLRNVSEGESSVTFSRLLLPVYILGVVILHYISHKTINISAYVFFNYPFFRKEAEEFDDKTGCRMSKLYIYFYIE
jgi:hypothetical protein